MLPFSGLVRRRFSLVVPLTFPARMAREQSPAVVRIATSWHWQRLIEQAPAYCRIGWFVRRIHFRVRPRSTVCFHSKPQRSMAPFPCAIRSDCFFFPVGNRLRRPFLRPGGRPAPPPRPHSRLFCPICACGYRNRPANSVLDSCAGYEIPVRYGDCGLYCRLSTLSR